MHLPAALVEAASVHLQHDQHKCKSSRCPLVFGCSFLVVKKNKTQKALLQSMTKKEIKQLVLVVWSSVLEMFPLCPLPPPPGFHFDNRCPIAAPVLGVL